MIKIGIDYYPEQWDRALWEEDAVRMRALGAHVIRIGEFAWSRMEPKDGEFDFAWLDDAIETISRQGMQVILGTPTNCAPLWLYQNHPDTVQWGRDGKPTDLGLRGHRCMVSPTFRQYAGRIVEEMAKRYAGRPEIFAWQLDNELESNHCTCPACRAAFREWLREKYGTLEALNRAWGNVVWSGEVSDWEQIQPLLSPDCLPRWHNPAYLLDYERFGADCTADFVRFQSEIIRRYNANAVITTNACIPANIPDFHKEFALKNQTQSDGFAYWTQLRLSCHGVRPHRACEADGQSDQGRYLSDHQLVRPAGAGHRSGVGQIPGAVLQRCTRHCQELFWRGRCLLCGDRGREGHVPDAADGGVPGAEYPPVGDAAPGRGVHDAQWRWGNLSVLFQQHPAWSELPAPGRAGPPPPAGDEDPDGKSGMGVILSAISRRTPPALGGMRLLDIAVIMSTLESQLKMLPFSQIL